VGVSVWGGPGLQGRRDDQQCEHDRTLWRQLPDGHLTGAGDDPGVNGEGQSCPFEWQLRQVREQPALPAAQLEPDRDGAGSSERRENEVAGTAAETALGEAEQDEQERGGEHARVVLQEPCGLAEAASERGVRPRPAGELRVEGREGDPDCGGCEHHAGSEREVSSRDTSR
jgi:hypothetical protein